MATPIAAPAAPAAAIAAICPWCGENRFAAPCLLPECRSRYEIPTMDASISAPAATSPDGYGFRCSAPDVDSLQPWEALAECASGANERAAPQQDAAMSPAQGRQGAGTGATHRREKPAGRQIWRTVVKDGMA
nr:unnamed protein product [Digitaria exilis]